jgi:hypothetical protein
MTKPKPGIWEYVILGYYRGGEEEIDTAETKTETQYLLKEYRLAYGSEWTIWSRKRRIKKQE